MNISGGPPIHLMPIVIRNVIGRRAHRLGVPVILIPVAALIWLVGCSTGQAGPVGLRAPVFALPSFGDGSAVGTAQLRGRPAIVVFWARMPAVRRGTPTASDQLRAST